MSNTVKLDILYRSQRDNALNPTGACNVTSVAMCLLWGGVTPQNKKVQLEDELYRYMESRQLSRHSPQDLATVVRDYGLNDNYTATGTIDAVKKHLSSGNPVITHGYFTAFGHIIVLVGYDSTGFIVHDPYGEWHATGYDTSVSGAYLHYSYELIKRTCIPDGLFWVHFISK
ncbi:C39 family peptidase [Microcoleus sp. herbarium14]|uniref:C39 family peptidase n=1 Tax=Microcoleus sp. herbarium14 TaxID=3055439 RepID=UPI002FD55A8F